MSIVICQIQSVIFVRNVIHAVEGGTPLETGNSNGGGLVAGCSPHTDKQILFHFTKAQQLCASRGGRPGFPVSNCPLGPCVRKATLNSNSNFDFSGSTPCVIHHLVSAFPLAKPICIDSRASSEYTCRSVSM